MYKELFFASLCSWMKGGTTQPPFIFDLALHEGWRSAACSCISSPSVQIQPGCKEVLQSVWNFIFLQLEATMAFPLWRQPHTAILSHISGKVQHKGDTSRVRLPFCVSTAVTLMQHPTPQSQSIWYSAGVLTTLESSDTSLYVLQSYYFTTFLGFPSVPNFKFSSIYLGAITSETINSVTVMVASSWDTDIVVLYKCKITITCISILHLPSYWTKLKKIAAQEEAPNTVARRPSVQIFLQIHSGKSPMNQKNH